MGRGEGREGRRQTSEMDEVEVTTKQCNAKKEVRRSEERRGHATSEKPPFCVFLCALPTFFVWHPVDCSSPRFCLVSGFALHFSFRKQRPREIYLFRQEKKGCQSCHQV